MTQQADTEIYTVVFLLDSNPPRNLVLLKRANWKSFAPNMYTGIGGREENDEGALHCVVRELKEETGIDHIQLTEFAQCILDDKVHLFYYWGIYLYESLPDCTEGELEWVSLQDVLNKPIIPTTMEVMKIWHKREFRVDNAFRAHAESIGKKDTYSLVRITQVIDYGDLI